MLALLLLLSQAVSAQVTFPLNSSGTMGLGDPNGDFFAAQDDLEVKVPGGTVRINRDFDGSQWVFNRQWSGLGNPAYYHASYTTIGAYFSCTIIDGVNSCDSTAQAGNSVILPPPPPKVYETRIPNDPNFGLDQYGHPLPDASTIAQIARKGIVFGRSTDGASYTSSKFPRFVIRPQLVPVLPASAGPDAHPAPGKPGQGGLATSQVQGYRWTDRTGAWIEYDNFGRISSYGDRNNVRVWMQYSSQHYRLERVLDDNGRTVFTLLYTNDGNFVTEVRDHTGASIRSVHYGYDGDGRLVQVIDARGNVTSYAYGTPGTVGAITSTPSTFFNIKKVTDAEGRITQIDYGVTGRIEKLTAPDGGVTNIDYGYDKLKKEFSVIIRHPQTAAGRMLETRRYDLEGRVVSVEVNGKLLLSTQGDWRSMRYTDARASSTLVTRDMFDQVTERTAADGTRRTYRYAAGSLDLTEVVDEAGVKTTLGYDSRGNLQSVVTADGLPEAQRSDYEYNARGELEHITRRGGMRSDGVTDPDAEMRMAYDSNGNVSQLTDGEGKVWHYAYNALGQITESTDPNNHVIRFTYDAHGNVLTTTDGNSNTTTYSYDKTDRPLVVIDPRGKHSQLSYDAAGRLQQLVDPYGAVTQLQHDLAGQMVAATDASGQTARLNYDSSGRMQKQIDGIGNEVTFDYSDSDGTDRGNGLITKTATPTVTRLLNYNARAWQTQVSETADGQTRTAKFAYDARGAVVQTTDPKGKIQTVEYDKLGRPMVQKDALGNSVTLDYDHRNNLVGITDPLGHRTRLLYDRRDKRVEEINPLGQSTRYQFDDAGRMTAVVRPSGATIALTYDDGGRLVERTAKRADGSGESRDTFEWDAANNMTGWHTPAASGVLTYDDNDLLLSETVSQRGVSLSRHYTYYPNHQVKTYTGPDGSVVNYAYNGNGQLERMDLPGAGSISVTARQWLAPTEVVFPGGSRLSITRDARSNATQVKLVAPNQTAVTTQSYVWGTQGEIEQRAIDGHSTAFTYDALLHLNQADSSGSGNDRTFTLDAAGNRTADNQTSGTWQYDAANRLTQRGSVSYTYDVDGNLIEKTDASGSGAQRSTHYLYDVYNRLTEVRDANDQPLSRYSYDAFSYRLSKEITATGGQASGAPVGVTLFLQAGEGLLAETNEAGAVTRSYGWYAAGDYGKTPLYLKQSGNYYYYINDTQGTPWHLIDQTGTIVWSASYDPYGEATVATGNTLDQPWRLPGQYYDAETGLHYNLHRYYDPEIGRYISQDPIGLSGGINAYLYANGSPTRYNDPRGLWVGFDDAIAIGGGAAVGILVQGAFDLYHGHLSGFDAYAGAAVNGAVFGEVMLYTGNPVLAGAAGGLAGDLTGQSIRILNGKQDGYNFCEALASTVLGAAGGKAGELLGEGFNALMAARAGKAAAALAGKSDAAGEAAANAVDDAAKAEAKFAFDARAGRYRDLSTGRFVAARDLPWPGNRGFSSSEAGVLQPGSVIDRFGDSSGRYAGQPGATVSERGMASGTEGMPYNQYEVLRPLPAQIGSAAPVPAFGAVGGATQYFFDSSIDELIFQGYLGPL